jgi:hypothetical protein
VPLAERSHWEIFACAGSGPTFPWKLHEYEWRCNWKIAVENDTECYHCPVVHRQSLNDSLDLSKLLHYEFQDHFFTQESIAPANANGDRAIYPPSTFVWPNILVSQSAVPSSGVDGRGYSAATS